MVVGDGRTKKVMVVLWCPARIREVVVVDEQDLGGMAARRGTGGARAGRGGR